MGLFSWLFGRRARVVSRDFVWLTDAARLRGAASSVRDGLAAGKSVLVVAHFPSTLAAFREHAADSGWVTAEVPNSYTPAGALALAAGSPRVLLGLGRNLRPDEFPAHDDTPASPLPVLVLERHFLREHDDRVVRFAEGLGGRAVEFHVSLDDPLMKLFAGEWVRGLLQKLGMEEDEALDSGMINRRVAAAQAKLARTIPGDHEADSPAAWLERNKAV
jgi:hypothetical protein